MTSSYTVTSFAYGVVARCEKLYKRKRFLVPKMVCKPVIQYLKLIVSSFPIIKNHRACCKYVSEELPIVTNYTKRIKGSKPMKQIQNIYANYKSNFIFGPITLTPVKLVCQLQNLTTGKLYDYKRS